MGYTAQTGCNATFEYRFNPRLYTTEGAAGNSFNFDFDSTIIRCSLREPHTSRDIHRGQVDIPKIGKSISVSWGWQTGKPKIVEVPLTPAISRSSNTAGDLS